jgi:hypothetical protein
MKGRLWDGCATMAFAAAMILAATPNLSPGAEPAAAWEVAGVWSEACDCNPPCPCWWKKPPTLGHCENTQVYKIEKGHYGKVSLDGLVVAVIWVSPKGKIMDESLDQSVLVALYVDRSTTAVQRAAVEKIWHSAFMAGAKAGKGGMKAVAFSIAQFTPGHIRVAIPGILAYDVKEWKNHSVALNDPYLSGFRQGSSIQYRYADYGMKWNYPGKHAFFARFHAWSSSSQAGGK